VKNLKKNTDMNDYPKIGAPPLQVWSKDVVDGDNNPMPAAGDE